MREFYFTFDGLKAGLRRDHRNPRNVQALVECMNAKAYERKLGPYVPFVLPAYTFAGAPVSLSLEWPFPQLIGGTDYDFLVIRDTLNAEDLVYTIGAGGVLTQIGVCDVLTYLAYGDRFDVADFGPYVLMTNGLMMVYYDILGTVWVAGPVIANVPLMGTVCNFRGQAVGGDIRSAWHGCGTDSVVWSMIGEMNFNPDLTNEAGFRNLPFSGSVRRVMELGDYVVVYGSNGILGMQPVSTPAATFGFKEVLDIGIPCKTAVGGNDKEHVFLGSDGWLRKIDATLTVKKLGYYEFMNPLGEVVVSFDPREEGEHYISDGVTGYVLTPWGLGQCHQLLSSVERINDEITGIFGDDGDMEYRVKTDTVDLGYRGLKTLQVLEHGLYSPTAARAGVEWRNDSSAFVDAGSRPLNDQGIVTRPISGAEFRLKFEADNYIDVELDYITARYKMTDMRSIRGIYAPPPRGQSAD